jgi:hypothetical protein
MPRVQILSVLSSADVAHFYVLLFAIYSPQGLDSAAKGSVNVDGRIGGTMPDQISDRLVTLATLDKTAICELWKELYQAPPPPRLRRDIMVRILAYRLQELTYGALSNRSLARLAELATRIEADGDPVDHDVPTIKPGTRLVREWRSETHVIHVEEDGFRYKDSRYGSLSEIARLITGTRRSGPLFFGLKSKRIGNVREAA